MLNVLRTSGERKRMAERACATVIARARAPVFYTGLDVADTLDGRFDLVVLHAWMVLARLGEQRARAQALVDVLFVSFDQGLRELGAGDMGIGRKMKAMADAFYGRMKAYDAAAGVGDLEAAILRNVYRGRQDCAAQARVLARYAASARAHVARTASATGEIDFGPLPSPSGSEP